MVARNGALLRELRLPKGRDLDWPVYQAVVDRVGRRLYLSYHGVRSTGVDAVDLVAGAWVRCPSPIRPVCGPGHGGLVFEQISRRLYVATGGPTVLALDPTTLRELAQIPIRLDRLERGHPMELATTGQHLIVADGCVGRAGVVVVGLPDGQVQEIDDLTCAERIAVSTDGCVAFAPSLGPRPIAVPGHLLLKSLYDVSTADLRSVPAEVVDLAFLPAGPRPRKP